MTTSQQHDVQQNDINTQSLDVNSSGTKSSSGVVGVSMPLVSALRSYYLRERYNATIDCANANMVNMTFTGEVCG